MKKRPNILLLVNDHQAYYGHEKRYGIKRPFYKKLAQKGVDFNRAYCTTPLCCPSRRTMVSGLYTCHHGQFSGQTDVEYSYETYLDRLKNAGYQVYYYGKWHTGKGTPGEFGAEGIFCEDYGNPYLLPSYREYLDKFNLPFPKAMIEHNWCTPGWIDGILEGKEYRLDRPTMNECISGILTTPKETHESFFLAYEVCRKLEVCKESEQPFFMAVEFWGPHQPYLPTREYADLYDPSKIEEYPSFRDDLSQKPEIYHFEGGRGISKDYKIDLENNVPWRVWAETMSRCYGQITMTDEAGGQILDKLEELGMAEDTLIIWTTDHGDGLACHGGHFDKDAYMAEEVLRIPFAIRYDGHVPAGEVSDLLVSNIDLAPTLLDAAGTNFSQPVDGKSLLSIWKDKAEPWRKQLYAESFGHHIPHRARVLIDEQYKYVRNEGQLEELYDLSNDPYELYNLVFFEGYNQELLAKRRALDDMIKKEKL